MATILGHRVGPHGYGLMGLTWRPDPPSQKDCFDLMETALATGANFWNGGEFYGTPERNSLHLLAEYFEAHPEDASKVLLSMKGGFKLGSQVPDGSEANIRRSVDACNAALRGTKKLDIFECARIDPNTPIEDTIKVLAQLISEGKIGGIGLSEVKADTIRRAHAVHPITIVEVELSLWETSILTNGVAQVCGELGIPIAAYAPLSRGALTGEFPTRNEDVPAHRRAFPKFQDDVLAANRRLSEEVDAIAKRKGCRSTQVALAWIRELGGRNGVGKIIPIPGAEKCQWIRDNNTTVNLTLVEMDQLDDTLVRNKTVGDRYSGALNQFNEG